MFCRYNETLCGADQPETPADQTYPQPSDTSEPRSDSRVESTSGVVVLDQDDDEGPSGILSDQCQVREVDALFSQSSPDTRKYPAPVEGQDCGMLSNFEGLCGSSKYFGVPSKQGSLSEGTQTCEMDSFFEPHRSDGNQKDSGGMPSDFSLQQGRLVTGSGDFLSRQSHVRDMDVLFELDTSDATRGPEIHDSGLSFDVEPSYTSSRHTETGCREGLSGVSRDHEIDSFLDQSSTDRSSWKCSSDRGIPSKFDLFHVGSETRDDSDRQEFLPNRTKVQQTEWVQEQRRPSRNFQEHFPDHRLGICIASEPLTLVKPTSGYRFGCLVDDDDDDDGMNLSLILGKNSENEARSSGAPIKLWQDEELPPPKRFKTSLPAPAQLSARKSSSAGDETVTSERLETSLSAVAQPTKKTSSFSGPCGVPVEKTLCTEEVVLPGSKVYSTRSVSLVQSGEGMHVITEEETVAHTVFDDMPPGFDVQNSRNGAQSGALDYCNTGDQWSGTKATRSLSKYSVDERVHEIILSQEPTSTVAVAIKMPSKTSMVGGTDRSDIAGGWKPVCGQTVIRKPIRPAQSMDRVGKQSQPPHNALWTSFDGSTNKSGTCQPPVSGQEGFGTAKNGQNDKSVGLPVSRTVTEEKSANLEKNSLPVSSVSATTTLLSRSNGEVAKARSFEEVLELARVRNVAKKNGGDSRSMAGNSVKNSAELLSRNGDEPVKRFEPRGIQESRRFQTNSSGYMVESATVTNVERMTSLAGKTRLASGVLGDGKDGHEGAVSKWQRFQETDDPPQGRQLPVMSSSLVKNTDQQSRAKTQTTSSNPARPQTTTSNQIMRSSSTLSTPAHTTTGQGSYQYQTTGSNHKTPANRVTDTGITPLRAEVQTSLVSKKPEVACVTPQVRQPLRALQLDHDPTGSSLPEDGVYLKPLSFKPCTCDSGYDLMFINICLQIGRVPACLAGVKVGAFTCVGWQVTLCDHIWQATARSSEVGFPGTAIHASALTITETQSFLPGKFIHAIL